MSAAQSMSLMLVRQRTAEHIQSFAVQIRDGNLSLAGAHEKLLTDKSLSLFQIAALAQVIACYQCEVQS